MGSLGMLAYNAPSEQFLNWGGPLVCALGGIIGVSILQIIYPYSQMLNNIRLWGGIAVMSGFVLFDTQMIMHKAKTQKQYDPISNAIEIYLDFIILFKDFVEILAESEKKKGGLKGKRINESDKEIDFDKEDIKI